MEEDGQQQANGGLEEHEPVRMCDVIRITGKQENCEAAKRDLLALVPVTVEVSLLEFYPVQFVILGCILKE